MDDEQRSRKGKATDPSNIRKRNIPALKSALQHRQTIHEHLQLQIFPVRSSKKDCTDEGLTVRETNKEKRKEKKLARKKTKNYLSNVRTSVTEFL